MLEKTLSLLSLLLSLLGVVLLAVLFQRMSAGHNLYTVRERLQNIQPHQAPDIQAILTSVRKDIQQISSNLSTSPDQSPFMLGVSEGDVDPTNPHNSLVTKAAQDGLHRKRAEWSEAVNLFRKLPEDPGAQAMAWRKVREARFETFAANELADKLNLKGAAYERAKALLLEEYFQIQGQNPTTADSMRGGTDKTIRRDIYRGNDAGYNKYLAWREEMKLRRKSQTP